MMYLTRITFPGGKREMEHIVQFGGSSYPYSVIFSLGLSRIDFEPITIFCGGNGSGKSTLLHIIAEKAGIHQASRYNKSGSYPDYVRLCELEIPNEIPENSRIITSDDVFDYMLDVRCVNEGMDGKREDLCQEYLTAKYADFQLHSLADYEELKRVTKARSITQTRFVKSQMMGKVSQYSNGENAFRIFTEKIGEKGLFLLDEPENSLSPDRQLELKGFIEDSARFFGCQFIISTHSPFLLALKGAKIYDLDENPAAVKKWTELENVRLYRDFFRANEGAF